MKKYFYLLLSLLILLSQSFNSLADSIAGGKIELIYSGTGDKYKVKVTLYVDDTFKAGDVSYGLGPSLYGTGTMPWIAIFAKTSSTADVPAVFKKQLSFVSKKAIIYDKIECVSSRTLATTEIVMETDIDLPAGNFNNAAGYYMVYDDGYRNYSDNIANSTITGIRLYTEFPSPSITKSSTPIFKPVANKVACLNQPFSVDLGASITNGNSLVHSPAIPFSGSGPLTVAIKNSYFLVSRSNNVTSYNTVSIKSGFSASNAVPGLSLNSAGILSGTPTQKGTFLITVECKEFKGGNAVGLVRQDVEIRVEDCNTPDKPKIYVEEGDPKIHRTNVVICDNPSSYRLLETALIASATYKWYKDGVLIANATTDKLKVKASDIVGGSSKYKVEITRSGASCGGPPILSDETELNKQNGANVKLNVPQKDYCEGGSTNIFFSITGYPLNSVNKWFKDGVDITSKVGTYPYASYNIPSITAATSGLYKVSVSDIYGVDKCTYEDSVKITITPLPIVEITNLTKGTGAIAICKGEKIELKVSPPQTDVSYQWAINGVISSSYTSPTISEIFSPNVYKFDVTATNTKNLLCFAAASPSVTITVKDFPTVKFDDIPTVCNTKGGKINLVNLVQPAYDGVLGKFSGTGITGAEFDPTVSGYGSFPIKYTYSTPEGCTKDASKIAIVDLTPVVKLGDDITIFRGDTVRIKSFGSTGPQYTYEWTPNSGVLAPQNSPQPLVSPTISNLYKVKVTSVLGKCSAQDDIFITVRPRLKFATAFTPNNDIINDTWAIDGIDEYPGVEVSIYNRWGGEIFHSIGYNQSFDGIQNRERLPAGTYFYVIKPSPDVPTLTGYLTIVR